MATATKVDADGLTLVDLFRRADHFEVWNQGGHWYRPRAINAVPDTGLEAFVLALRM
jgi:hypothetical protein